MNDVGCSFWEGAGPTKVPPILCNSGSHIGHTCYHISHILPLLLGQYILYYAQNVYYCSTNWAYGLISLFLSIISEFMIRLRVEGCSVAGVGGCRQAFKTQAPSLGHIFIKLSYQLLDSIAQNTYAINMLLIYIIYNYKWRLLGRYKLNKQW